MDYIFYCKKCNYLKNGHGEDLNFFWTHETNNNRCLNKGEYMFNSSTSLGIVFVVMDKIQ